MLVDEQASLFGTLRRSRRIVKHRLDVVAVRIEYKCGVVARTILGAVAWRAIVLAAGFPRGSIKIIHHLFTRSSKRETRK